MANQYMTASAAIGTAAGYQNRASRIFITGDQAVETVGSVTLKTGGTSGTAMWKAFMDGGSSGQFTIPNVQFDYVTIDNVEVCIEYYKAHGFK